MDFNKITENIEGALLLGMLKKMFAKESGTEINKEQIQIWHKEDCETAQELLQHEGIKVIEFEKFSNMVKTCDLAMMLTAMSKDNNLTTKLILEAVKKHAESCLEQDQAVQL